MASRAPTTARHLAAASHCMPGAISSHLTLDAEALHSLLTATRHTPDRRSEPPRRPGWYMARPRGTRVYAGGEDVKA